MMSAYRQLKFRVFLKDPDRMQYCDPDNLTAFFRDYEHKKVPGMQFTGLTDFKGRDVYESDIVKRYCPCTNVGCTKYWIGEVAYRNGSLIFRDHKEQVDSPLEMFAEMMEEGDQAMAPLEVIGNIYMNNELLLGGLNG